MRKTFFTSALLLFVVECNAQSDSLKSAYRQICTTLKEYRFQSEDTNRDTQGKTLSITLTIQNGAYIFTFNDDYRPFEDPFFGHRHGIKTVKVPINEAKFASSYFPEINISGENGVEFVYKGKKELLSIFEIHGEKLTVN